MALLRVTLALLVVTVCARQASAQAEKGNAPANQETPKKAEATSAPASELESVPTTAPPSAKPALGIWDLIVASGSIGFLIILLSIIAVALVIEHLLTIRRSTLIPPGLAEELHHCISARDFVKAEQACKLRPSYLSFVVLSGIQEAKAGYTIVEKAMEDASQEQAARLFRKVEYLALIGNVAPMLGLLGTVVGLVMAFKQVAETQGAAVAADLADGIYMALVTTVEGLVVSIPALIAYAMFKSRIEELASAVNVAAEQVFINFRRGVRAAPKQAGEPPALPDQR